MIQSFQVFVFESALVVAYIFMKVLSLVFAPFLFNLVLAAPVSRSMSLSFSNIDCGLTNVICLRPVPTLFFYTRPFTSTLLFTIVSRITYSSTAAIWVPQSSLISCFISSTRECTIASRISYSST